MKNTNGHLLFAVIMASVVHKTSRMPSDPSHRQDQNKHSKTKDGKMPLTEEEKAKLSLLSGSAKKNYVKELKQKYEV